MLIERVLRRKLTTPTFKSAVLPTGSTLHRVNENFTPFVKAQPELNVTALAHSVQRRGLTDAFNSGFFERLIKQNQEVRDYEEEVERLETQRLNLHTEFQEASRIGDEARQTQLRAASRRTKNEKNRYKKLHRNLSFSIMEDLLNLPNKLRETESALPSESWFGDTSKSTVPFPGAIKAADLDDSTVYKDCGTYFTGNLATFTQEMSSLLELLGREVESALGSVPRRCALSDLVRLPVAEACAWTPSLDEVIQIEHTKDDVFIPKEGGQPLINPYTRLCLVGSASLAAFVGSFFGCCLDKECPLPLHFLTLGNIYTYASEVKKPIGYPFKQTRQVSLFCLESDENTSVSTFDKLATTISEFWAKFQPHWRLRLRAVPVEELRRCEMSLWSLALVERSKPDIELARISLLGDWVSRRAGFKTFDGSFPFMVFSDLINFENLLAAIRTSGSYLPTSK
ncbi:hypothetical protein ECG_03026 [Echinococcus granulosus]|uniref:Uncharacterized protein n=1 Tax=Echinococcus granulosus TaxID=6210 RepID=A0A068WQR3_ECHGR|nr:hypothetical protein ECG_03026 [Echinococcus granulosus]CDS20005.1 hypothetical protein EgrG_000219300 [Echinococcus granulosus]